MPGGVTANPVRKSFPGPTDAREAGPGGIRRVRARVPERLEPGFPNHTDR
jgi:hypothetical protein